MGAASVPAPWRQVVGGAEVEHVALAVESAVAAEVLSKGVVEQAHQDSLAVRAAVEQFAGGLDRGVAIHGARQRGVLDRAPRQQPTTEHGEVVSDIEAALAL